MTSSQSCPKEPAWLQSHGLKVKIKIFDYNKSSVSNHGLRAREEEILTNAELERADTTEGM